MPRNPETRATRTGGDQLDVDDGGIVRLATVLPIPTLLRARGIDPTELLASVGLDSAA